MAVSHSGSWQVKKNKIPVFLLSPFCFHSQVAITQHSRLPRRQPPSPCIVLLENRCVGERHTVYFDVPGSNR